MLKVDLLTIPRMRTLSLGMPMRNEISSHVYPTQMMMWAKAAIDWKKYAGDQAGLGFHYVPHCHVAEARCRIACEAVNDLDELVLWMDDDMDPPGNAFYELYNVYQSFVKQGIKVGGISASCHSAYPPFHSYLKVAGSDDWLPIGFDARHLPDVIEVVGCGFGLILTPIEVLRDVREKYGDEKVFEWRPNGVKCGEDQDFINKARQLDYRFFGLPHVEVGHLHVGITNDEHVDMVRRSEAYEDPHDE